ncbi:hypothetical protein KY366_07285 [Candidatus Woesearchaeota archaeon]|nr:hypothetical protein [Candidatus Woesearchaeota archaeon]
MNKNNTKKALSDMEENILLFYRQMIWILGSKRGRRFQFMMLNKAIKSTIYRYSQIRRKYLGKEELPKSPLDT